MKVRVFLLAAFTILNGGLIFAFIRQPSLAPRTLREYLSQGNLKPTATASVARAAAGPAKAAAPGNLWSVLHSADLATLVRRLREAGFPPSMVRAIVDAEIERQFGPRIRELTRSVTETPYWQQDPGFYSGNAKLFESINQIYRERSRVLRELLGNDAFAYSGIDPTAAQRRQFGNLSPAKIDLVQRIADDYAEMMGQVRSAMQGVALPEDREKLALLEREKRADLAAVLTPDELGDYEMRTSQITMRLRTAFTIMDANEAEFRTIYRAYDSYKDILYPMTSGGIIFSGSDVMEQRREAMKQVHAQLKMALGDTRFAEYQRSTDSDFQQLYRLGQRDNIPNETLVRAFDSRNAVAEASIKIVDDPAMSPAQKASALKELAQTARTTLLSTLGPAAGPTYVSSSRWLNQLEQGRGFSIGPDGSMTPRGFPVPPPASTATPKR